MGGRIGQLHGEKILGGGSGGNGSRPPAPARAGCCSFDSPAARNYVAHAMHLTDFFAPDAISLDLRGDARDEILAELVGLLRLDERASDTLLRMLQRREILGSTGVGRGIAIPHC